MRAEPPFPLSPAHEGAEAPLIAHVIYRFDVGGLENGLVNLINRLPTHQFRHAIIALTDYSDFRERLQRRDVPVFALHRAPGNSPGFHVRLWRLLKRLQPHIVHTRNLAALEASATAAVAGVPVRIHSEHGRDMADLDGDKFRYHAWRAAFRPFVHQYVALSKDLERYLLEKVRIPASRVLQLYNGVDTDRFHPALSGREPLPPAGLADPDAFVIGTVGRMQSVKDPLNLARAFLRLREIVPPGRALKLVMVGDGPLQQQVHDLLRQGGAGSLVWLPGERDDVAEIMRGLDLFVLPSLAEGISNTILEAMASGLPVVATAVGGNPELVDEGRTGCLVPRADPEALAQTMLRFCNDDAARRRQGHEARLRAERRFSMSAMVSGYVALYNDALERHGVTGRSRSCAES